MLILSRFRGEEIDITLEDGRVIKVAVVAVSRGKVRIGIEAANTIIVDRAEVTERKALEVAADGVA